MIFGAVYPQAFHTAILKVLFRGKKPMPGKRVFAPKAYLTISNP